MDRIIERDPEISALRRSVLRAELGVERALPWREPELRLAYGKTSGAAIPDPYTVTSEETITQRGTSVDDRYRTGTQGTIEHRLDRSAAAADPGDVSASQTIQSSASFSGQQRESRDFVETTTRTTVREVIPGAQSRVTRERTTETVTEDYRERGQESSAERGGETRTPVRPSSLPGGADAEDYAPTRFTSDVRAQEQRSDQGLERTRLVEERVEEETYGFDPYQGSEDYSVEIRVRPPHPWERKARKALARAEVQETAFALEAAERALRLEVQAQYLALQFAAREAALLRREEQRAVDEASFTEDLMSAGEANLGDLAKLQVQAFELQRKRAAAEAEVERGRDGLAARAGLADPEVIRPEGPLVVAAYRPDELALDRLLPVAVEIRAESGRLAAVQEALRQELAVTRSQRIPWFSLVSASYDYETRGGDKYRDEYRVMVGMDIPVFAWFRDDDRLVEQQLKWVRDDEEVARERIRLELARGIERLQSRTAADREDRARLQALRERLSRSMEALPTGNVAARRQRMAMEGALLALERRVFEMERAQAVDTLSFEQILGARLAEVLGLAADDSDAAQPRPAGLGPAEDQG